MKQRNKSFFKNSPFRIAISLFMAFLLILSYNLNVCAKVDGYFLLQSDFWKGTFTQPFLTINVPYDHYEYNVLATDPSKPSIYAKSSNNTHFYTIDYPVWLGFTLQRNDSYDMSYLQLLYSMSPKVSFHLNNSNDVCTAHIYNVKAQLILNINGKEYVSDSSPFDIIFDDTISYRSIFVSMRLSFMLTISDQGQFSSPSSSLGYLTVSSSVSVNNSYYYGFNQTTNGDQKIIDAVNNQNTSVVGAITDQTNKDKTNTQNIINNQTQIVNDQTDTLTNGYDSSSGNSSVNDLNNAFNAADAAQGTAVSDAKVSLEKYSFSDTLKFSADLMAGLSFIYSLANAFFTASGNFSVLVTAVYCMAFLSIVLGLWRFFRGSD